MDLQAIGMAEDDLRAYVEEPQSSLAELKARNEELESRNADATGGVSYDPGEASREHKDRLCFEALRNDSSATNNEQDH